jgi:hypothetical protein
MADRRTLLFFLWPFLLGAALGCAVWDLVALPFTDPWGQCSVVTRERFAPANNMVRFAIVVALPILVMALRHMRRPSHRSSWSDRAPASDTPAVRPRRPDQIGLLLLGAVIALLSPTFLASGPFDTFHEGECLGPAVSYAAGQVPYRDVLFVHGVFQDPGRAVLAFALFGRSIGAVRTLESLILLTAWVLLALWLVRQFRARPDHALIALLVMGLLSVSGALILLPRDVLTVAMLLVVQWFAFRAPQPQVPAIPAFGAAVLMGMLPGVGLAYSFDRGTYLALIACATLPALLWGAAWTTRRKRQLVLGTGVGAVAGAVVLAWALRWDVRPFLQFYFVELPQFKDRMDAYIYDVSNPLFSIPVLGGAFIAYAVAFMALHAPGRDLTARLRHLLRHHLMTVILVIAALLLFRNALGRADALHIRYSWTFIALALTCLAVRSIPQLRPSLARPIAPPWRTTLMAGLIGLGLLATWRTDGLRANFPLGVPDRSFIPPDDQATVDHLRATLGPDDGFITLTGEAGWYYYLDRPCPIRFNVVQFAQLPAYQQEVIDALASGRITHVLYRNTNWYIALDGCTNHQRIPAIMAYIDAHFAPSRTIGHNEIWTLRR